MVKYLFSTFSRLKISFKEIDNYEADYKMYINITRIDIHLRYKYLAKVSSKTRENFWLNFLNAKGVHKISRRRVSKRITFPIYEKKRVENNLC